MWRARLGLAIRARRRRGKEGEGRRWKEREGEGRRRRRRDKERRGEARRGEEKRRNSKERSQCILQWALARSSTGTSAPGALRKSARAAKDGTARRGRNGKNWAKWGEMTRHGTARNVWSRCRAACGVGGQSVVSATVVSSKRDSSKRDRNQ